MDLKERPRSSAARFLTPPVFLRASIIIAFANTATVHEVDKFAGAVSAAAGRAQPGAPALSLSAGGSASMVTASVVSRVTALSIMFSSSRTLPE